MANTRAASAISHASAQVRALNPHIFAPENASDLQIGVRQRKAMNRTEESFLAYLRKLFPGAQIDREGITLRWEDGMTYTPDFVVYASDGIIILYETKGPFIRRTGLEKFRAARGHWTSYDFEMWQRDKAYRWKKIL